MKQEQAVQGVPGRKEDQEIKITLKMSEANFILSALSGVKFRADSVMHAIVSQGDSQLARPSMDDANLPVGISTEIDDAILEVFTPIWQRDPNSMQFDFSKKGHLIVICKVEGELLEQLKQDAQAVADQKKLMLSINDELEGGVVFVFSVIRPDDERADGSKKELLTDEDAEADLKGEPRPSKNETTTDA